MQGMCELEYLSLHDNSLHHNRPRFGCAIADKLPW